MKKQKNKQGIKASKLAKAENKLKKQAEQIITVKNAEGNPDTEAKILIQNKINYTPKVSVIIPVYNVEEYLRECLDSVTNQTLKEIEIICIDDGSTDTSLLILKEYADKDNRITVLAQKNSGSGKSRNHGIKNAKGEFISFMDSDDLYPNKKTLENLYSAAKKNNVNICGGSLNQLKDGKLITDPSQFEDGYTFKQNGLMEYKDYQFDFGYWRFIYNRTFLIENEIYFPDYLRQQDPPFFIKAMCLSNIFYALKEPTYVYRISYKQVKWTERKVLDFFYACYDCLYIAQQYKYAKTINNTVARLNWNLTRNIIKSYILDSEPLRNAIAKIYGIYCTLSNKYNIMKLAPLYRIVSEKKCIEKPLISIVVPVYNIEKYIAKCVESILMSYYTNLEIICVNDGSTDNSLEILQSFAEKDHRIKIVSQKNGGLSAARNTGLSVAKGKYIHFLDGDDFISPDIYSSLLQEMILTDANCIIFNHQDYTESGVKNGYTHNILAENKNKYINQDLVIKHFLGSIWNKFFDLSIVKKYNIKFPDGLDGAEDVVFMAQFVLNKPIVYSIMSPHLFYRRDNVSSITHNTTEAVKKEINCDRYLLNTYLWNVSDIETKYMIVKRLMQNISYQLSRCKSDAEINNSIGYINDFLHEICKVYGEKLTASKEYKFLQGKVIEEVPIVYAVDNKYFQYMYVSIFSLLENCYKFMKFHIYIFHTDLTKFNLRKLKKLNRNNVIIEAVNVNSYIKNIRKKLVATSYFSKEMYYRLLIPKILKKYEKVVYLDCDTIICDDILDLYNVDMSENILGGCRNPCDSKTKLYREEKLGINSDNYINSGVLVFNNSLWNSSDIEDKILKQLEHSKEYLYPDQDIINICCNKILYIDETYNYMWHLESIYANKSYLNSHIIHYTSNIKPWNSPHKKGAEVWWKYAKRSENISLSECSNLVIYLLFPFYMCKLLILKRTKSKKVIDNLKTQLSSYRIDIKNFGTSENSIEVTAEDCKISKPNWFTNEAGKGQVVEGIFRKQVVSVRCIKGGNLALIFKGLEKRLKNKCIPVWINYKSIKIDGKEILSAPIAIWHDKPFRYEMPVKDGQIVKVEVAQQYHQYSKDELKDVILKLNPNSEYIKENIEKLTNKIYKKITVNNTTIKSSPQTTLFAKVKKNLQKHINLWYDKFSFARKIEAIMDLMQKNQLQIMKMLQEIQAKNTNLENKNNELKKEIEVLKGTFNTQLSDFKKQQEERSKQLMAVGDKLSAELQRATNELQNAEQSQTGEIKATLSSFIAQLAETEAKLSSELKRATNDLQNSGISDISQIKTYCADFAHQLGITEVKLLHELNTQRETALQNKNNIISGINQTEQSLQIQVAKSQELAQKQQTTLNRVQERLEDLSALKEIDFAQKSELNVLSQDIEKQKFQLFEKIQNLQHKAQLQYQELNFADLLHDSTQNSPWLKDKNFALYGGAANYSFIYTLFRILDNIKPIHILEMGLGQTSMVTTQYIKNNKPEADLDIIENDENWIKIYEPKLAKSQNIKLHQCDIEFFDYEGEQSRKYKELRKITRDKKYNLIIVDGPFGGAQKLPRSNIVELVEHNLAQDFIIIFDDAERPGEQNTIAQTKAKLASQGIEFGVQQRNALKSQILIFSKSCEFAKYL